MPPPDTLHFRSQPGHLIAGPRPNDMLRHTRVLLEKYKVGGQLGVCGGDRRR